jgi:hypothetical protein
MPLDLADYERKARKAVRAFWKSRDKSGVRQGGNLDQFVLLIEDIVRANGLASAEVHQKIMTLTLPGYFRPTKRWDILVINKNELIAAIELKSQVGSFGKNFNNRAEESIGSALDFWTAYREGAFGKQSRPFLGWLMLVEDAHQSRTSVKDHSPQFDIFNEFKGASYLRRYDILCQKLVQEQLYTTASVVTTCHASARTGDFSELSPMTSLKAFVASLAGHIAASEARLGCGGAQRACPIQR